MAATATEPLIELPLQAPYPLSGRQYISLVVLPGLAVMVLTLLARFTEIDLHLARAFYDPQTQSWPWVDHWTNQVMYHWGNIPAQLLGVIGLVVAVAANWNINLRRYQLTGWFFALALTIGPGLIVNLLLKDHFGRPRPREILEFGGTLDFLPVWVPGVVGVGKSFPSGHASMGFFWMLPFFVLITWRPRLAWTFAILGTFYGCVMGLSRVAMGAHWFSDSVWSAAVVYYTGLLLARALGLLPLEGPTHARAFSAPRHA